MSTLAGGGVFSTSGDTMSTLVDLMSTSGDIQYIGGYHDAYGGANQSNDILQHSQNRLTGERWLKF